MRSARAVSNKNLLSLLNLIELAFINFQLNNRSLHLLKIQLYLSFRQAQAPRENNRRKTELNIAELILKPSFQFEHERCTRDEL